MKAKTNKLLDGLITIFTIMTIFQAIIFLGFLGMYALTPASEPFSATVTITT